MYFRKKINSLINIVFQSNAKNNIKNAYQRHNLKKGPRIVVIGGGTGLSILLRGIKEYTSNITAIVAVTDDGGSSGRLRGQFGILPPGDLRNCLVALADTEPIMERLFDYRFTQGKELVGHNLGNLLITAMVDLTGSFETAINELGKVLAIRGRVLPPTFADLVLAAELVDGSMIKGESYIAKSKKPIKKVFLIPGICEPSSDAIKAIKEADAIILGPGSLYTSIIPNLLVPGIVEAIQEAKATKMYVCNVMTQPGETKNYKASEHLKAVYSHSLPGLVDYMIVNNQKAASFVKGEDDIEEIKYVEIDQDKIAKMSVKLLQAPLIQENNYNLHSSKKLASMILQLILKKKGG